MGSANDEEEIIMEPRPDFIQRVTHLVEEKMNALSMEDGGYT